MQRVQRQSLPGEVVRTLGSYIQGQLQVSAILACVYIVGFAIAGVPWWAFVGFIAGFLQLVPVFGSLCALLLGAFAVLLGEGGLNQYIGVLIVFVVAQALEGFYLTPRILGSRLGISRWLVFFGLIVGGLFFGPLGVLLAVPVIAVLLVIWRRRRLS
jgi:predicted PurR-regulated permease PerM